MPNNYKLYYFITIKMVCVCVCINRYKPEGHDTFPSLTVVYYGSNVKGEFKKITLNFR